MQEYQCHKKVHALKIGALVVKANLVNMKGVDRHTLYPADTAYAPFEVSIEYVRKHDPQPGGYYVVYEDGYQSYSPAEAFEAGYTLVAPNATPNTE